MNSEVHYEKKRLTNVSETTSPKSLSL